MLYKIDDHSFIFSIYLRLKKYNKFSCNITQFYSKNGRSVYEHISRYYYKQFYPVIKRYTLEIRLVRRFNIKC